MSADIHEILESAFVPKLLKNIDDFQLSDELFAEFKEQQTINTQILFDGIQQYKKTENTFDSKIKSTLIVLFSERLANYKTACYKDENKRQTEYMKSTVLELMKNIDKSTLEKILSYYTEKLNSDSWRTEIGALNGFVNFIEYYLESNRFKDQWLHFSLSIGFKLTQLHDEEWKSLGLSVLDVILTKGDTQQIEDSNIHNLIYDEVSKILLGSSSDILTCEANNTLLKFLKFSNCGVEDWGKRDDIIQLNIRKLKLSSSAELCSNIVNTISKVALKGELDLIFTGTLKLSSLDKVCDECKEFDNVLAMRWSKTILETISNIVLFLNTTNTLKAKELITSFSRSYLVFVYLVPKIVLQYQMGMIEKLVTSIFDTTTMHEENEYLEELIVFLTIIQKHMKSSKHTFEESESLEKQLESCLCKVEKIKDVNKILESYSFVVLMFIGL
ncbi:hypothetical protein ACFFRR_006843 [Megaselia abdita]